MTPATFNGPRTVDIGDGAEKITPDSFTRALEHHLARGNIKGFHRSPEGAWVIRPHGRGIVVITSARDAQLFAAGLATVDIAHAEIRQAAADAASATPTAADELEEVSGSAYKPMTGAELNKHETASRGRDFARSSDGRDDMEVAGEGGWEVLSSWGRDGWALARLPYVAVCVRDVSVGPRTPEDRRYQMQRIVEGDHTVYEFPTDGDRARAIDYLFLWYAADQRWAPLTWEDRDRLERGELMVDPKWRGPARSAGTAAPEDSPRPAGTTAEADGPSDPGVAALQQFPSPAGIRRPPAPPGRPAGSIASAATHGHLRGPR